MNNSEEHITIILFLYDLYISITSIIPVRRSKKFLYTSVCQKKIEKFLLKISLVTLVDFLNFFGFEKFAILLKPVVANFGNYSETCEFSADLIECRKPTIYQPDIRDIFSRTRFGFDLV